MRNNILLKQARERHAAERQHIFEQPLLYFLLLLGTIAADSASLYSVFDLVLTQQPWLSIVITLTISGCLNVAPVLLATSLRSEGLKHREKRMLCGALCCLFMIFLIATFALRFASRDMMFGSSELNITISGTDSVEKSSSLSDTIAATLVGLEPLGTSIIMFGISLTATSPKRKRTQLLEIQRIELQEEIHRLEDERRELETDKQFDQESYDEELREATIALIRAKGKRMRSKSKQILSEKIGTAEGISFIMEEGHLEPGQVENSE